MFVKIVIFVVVLNNKNKFFILRIVGIMIFCIYLQIVLKMIYCVACAYRFFAIVDN
jgi:hypothetical protein